MHTPKIGNGNYNCLFLPCLYWHLKSVSRDALELLNTDTLRVNIFKGGAKKRFLGLGEGNMYNSVNTCIRCLKCQGGTKFSGGRIPLPPE